MNMGKMSAYIGALDIAAIEAGTAPFAGVYGGGQGMITETYTSKSFTEGNVTADLAKGDRGTVQIFIYRAGQEVHLRLEIGDASDLIECLQAALKEAL